MLFCDVVLCCNERPGGGIYPIFNVIWRVDFSTKRTTIGGKCTGKIELYIRFLRVFLQRYLSLYFHTALSRERYLMYH